MLNGIITPGVSRKRLKVENIFIMFREGYMFSLEWKFIIVVISYHLIAYILPLIS